MESKPKKIVQSRQIISKVYNFLKTEYEFTLRNQGPNCDLSHLENIIQRTAEATNVTERTVQRIIREDYDGPSTSASKDKPPVKIRTKRDTKVDVDGCPPEVIRSTIQEFHVVLKQIPTLSKLLSALQDKVVFNGSLDTLRTLLTKMGYQARKTDHNMKVLVERHDIQMRRFKYIKKIREYRAQGRPIVYIDLSYLLTTRDQNELKKEKESADIHFIIAHAGTEAGFIDNACLVSQAYTPTEHKDFNFGNYVKWINENLLPNLPDRSVIVLDSKYNIPAEKMPTSATKLSEMQKWLTEKGIQFDSNLCKVELYGIIKKHKSDLRTCQINEYIKSKGFEILRPPPYHPELNAIENIWKVLKTYVDITNLEECMMDTEYIIYEGIENITGNTWRHACNSVVMKEVEYMKYFDADLEFIVNVQDYDGDETTSEGSSSDSS
ncbi:hypothetical protein PYW08_007615 [Mythimna loreyi]|uniref:Uncharacterized protein n=1 Tax=Mythimna loreyi TaxID=667449 RepID=A0ACC2QE75_9NEOP|nr:hypothetical protein PYW08_007615 [Mythimna loreyi]